MHILTGNLIRDLPTNRVNGLSAQVWRSCSETGPIIHLGSKVGRGETLKKPWPLYGFPSDNIDSGVWRASFIVPFH